MLTRNLQVGGGVMVTYRHHSAQVKCQPLNRALQAQYTGPMSLSTCLYLGALVRGFAGNRATLECVCKSLTMAHGGSNPDLGYLSGSAPGCYVVRPDQYDLMLELTGVLTALGVQRLVFLESEAQLAKGWLAAFG